MWITMWISISILESCRRSAMETRGKELQEDNLDVSDNDREGVCSNSLQDVGFTRLREGDIPGASLRGKQPAELNVRQLKRWLSCRGAAVGGRKADLIAR